MVRERKPKLRRDGGFAGSRIAFHRDLLAAGTPRAPSLGEARSLYLPRSPVFQAQGQAPCFVHSNPGRVLTALLHLCPQMGLCGDEVMATSREEPGSPLSFDA